METKETPINSTYLSEEELDHFKELLIEEKIKSESKIKSLEESIDEIENKMDDTSSGAAHHQGDLGSNEALRETNYTLIEKQKEKLEQITAAFDRIETGNYGICIVTGDPIQKGRLEAMPYALHSVEAKKGAASPASKERLSINSTN